MWLPAAGALSLCLEKPYSFVMSAGDSYFTSVQISDVPVSATASTFCSTQHGDHRNMSSVAAQVMEAAHKALKAVCSHAYCVISLHGCPHGPWSKNGRLLEIMWGQNVGSL